MANTNNWLPMIAMPGYNIMSQGSAIRPLDNGTDLSLYTENMTPDRASRVAHAVTNDVTTTNLHIAPFKDQSEITLDERFLVFNRLMNKQKDCKTATVLSIPMINYWLEMVSRTKNEHTYNYKVMHCDKKQKLDDGTARQLFVDDIEKWHGLYCNNPTEFSEIYALLGVIRTIQNDEPKNIMYNNNYITNYNKIKFCERISTIATDGTCETFDIWDSQAGDKLYLIVKYIDNDCDHFYAPSGAIINTQKTMGQIMQVIPVKNWITMENNDEADTDSDRTQLKYKIVEKNHPKTLTLIDGDWVEHENNNVDAKNLNNIKREGVEQTNIAHVIYVGRANKRYAQGPLDPSRLRKAMRSSEIMKKLPIVEIHLGK